jgi:hypothetical protein
MLSIHVLWSVNIPGTDLAQTFFTPTVSIFWTHLFPQFPVWLPFLLQSRLSYKTISLTRCILSGVCAVCGLPVRGESRKLRTAIDSVISIHIFQSLVNVSHCFILTTQELYNSTLLLTNIKWSSHFKGVLWQRYARERVELNVNTSGKNPFFFLYVVHVLIYYMYIYMCVFRLYTSDS